MGNLDSEVASIMKKSGGGAYYQTGDMKNAVQFVERIKNDKGLAEKYGIKSREFMIAKFSKQQVLKQFKDSLIALNQEFSNV